MQWQQRSNTKARWQHSEGINAGEDGQPEDNQPTKQNYTKEQLGEVSKELHDHMDRHLATHAAEMENLLAIGDGEAFLILWAGCVEQGFFDLAGLAEPASRMYQGHGRVVCQTKTIPKVTEI